MQPSHVDLATQQNYQNMDKNFVGLIFSVFDVDFKRMEKFECQNYEAIAFQTRSGECHYLDLEVGKPNTSPCVVWLSRRPRRSVF